MLGSKYCLNVMIGKNCLNVIIGKKISDLKEHSLWQKKNLGGKKSTNQVNTTQVEEVELS